MRQRHPMELASLAPYGFVFPGRQQRLAFKPSDPSWVNEEVVIMRLWDRVNRHDAPRPLPAEMILHIVLPSLGGDTFDVGDFTFEGQGYRSRDILVLSSTLQWFGTNVGRCFLESRSDVPPPREFVEKLKHETKEKGDMVPFFVPVCTEKCTPFNPLSPFGGGCHYGRSSASPRDRDVVKALMVWLGSDQGRAFLRRFTKLKKHLWKKSQGRRRLLRSAAEEEV